MSRVTFLTGRGGLPKLENRHRWSTAEIYLHGAHVTRFQETGCPPLLFLSDQSRFEPNVPIRGHPDYFPVGRQTGGQARTTWIRSQSFVGRKEIASPATGITTLNG